MTELELYKFLYDEDCYNLKQSPTWWLWLDQDKDDELLVWVSFYGIENFTKLVGRDYLSDIRVMINLQEDCVVLDLVPICANFGIDPENICKKGSE